MTTTAGPARSRGGRLGSLAAVAVLASAAVGQTPSAPSAPLPPPTPLPPPASAPRLAAPPAVMPLPTYSPLPPTPLEAAPFPPVSGPVTAGPSAVVIDESRGHHVRKPLPGTVEDEVGRDYLGREGFRCCWNGCEVTLFPTTLLWEPPLAVKREPRLQLLATALDDGPQGTALDASFGVIPGVVRFRPQGSDLSIQVDVFGVAHTRWYDGDLAATQFRWGVPVTFARGPWHAKVAYEQTRDRVGAFVGPLPAFALPAVTRPADYDRDDLAFGLGRYVGPDLRLYGQAAYALSLDGPGAGTDPDRWRFDLGFEWYERCPTGLRGQPFLAANLDVRGEANYEAGVTLQAGWMWRHPDLRLAEGRVFVEYYNGRSPFGPLSGRREEFVAFGIAGDY